MHPALITLEKTLKPSILTRIGDPLLDRNRITLWMKRDDLLHPVISGNKWRKLKYGLDHALSLGSDTIISMGGAYSNHLHALAYAGKSLGLNTIGLIRGKRPDRLTPTLQDCQNWGMELRFISRTEYRRLRQCRSPNDLPEIKAGQYWLPEGGSCVLALKGVSEMVDEIEIPYDVLCLPCGTGATLAGCIAADGYKQVIGFAALKNADFLAADVQTLLTKTYPRWTINGEYHFGGFAKTTPDLIEFIHKFESKTGIPLDPVYTGKMMYALFDLIPKGYFQPGLCIVAVHTGGLQGKRQ
ncbi:MAG: 1-aminocyclopropane-1-carboxylate deaminase/D-cysteine desulfhydrase [Gammaproteobacteria bacterium]